MNENLFGKTEVREYIFHPHFQKVEYATNLSDDLSKASFVVEGHTAKVVFNGRYTIVILDGEFEGRAMCMEGDVFSRKKGLKIAYNRAMIKFLEAETDFIAHEE